MVAVYRLCLAAAALASSVFASRFTHDRRYTVERDGQTHHVFEHRATGVQMSFVKNSGICEKTPGVNQYSGYISVDDNMYMFFWFFEARSRSSTAPLAAWFNGGPGCSSMIGLFRENGPCRFVNGASDPSTNPYSWNNYANMLYIDQPIGVGFSYGTYSRGSTVLAATLVWKFLQAFYASFPQYQSRNFGIFTEGYGGHYGPQFASYLQQQNKAISIGTVKGQKINLIALGINNGWIDPKIQYKALIDYAYYKNINPYNQIITDGSVYSRLVSQYNNNCVPALTKCYQTPGDSTCSPAQKTCYQEIENAISQLKDFDIYDVRQPRNSSIPPKTYQTYLANGTIRAAIGARAIYNDCYDNTLNRFNMTGDRAQTFLPTLSTVTQSGIQVLLWAGDADWSGNWVGNLLTANAINYTSTSTFAAKAVIPYTINGRQVGTFKSVGNLSFLRLFAAGQEVPYYAPDVALQVFGQLIQGKPITAT